jgi:hypothetical protein
MSNVYVMHLLQNLIKVSGWWLGMKHLIAEFRRCVVRQATMQSTDSSGDTKYKHQRKWVDVTTAKTEVRIYRWTASNRGVITFKQNSG